MLLRASTMGVPSTRACCFLRLKGLANCHSINVSSGALILDSVMAFFKESVSLSLSRKIILVPGALATHLSDAPSLFTTTLLCLVQDNFCEFHHNVWWKKRHEALSGARGTLNNLSFLRSSRFGLNKYESL